MLVAVTKSELACSIDGIAIEGLHGTAKVTVFADLSVSDHFTARWFGLAPKLVAADS